MKPETMVKYLRELAETADDLAYNIVLCGIADWIEQNNAVVEELREQPEVGAYTPAALDMIENLTAKLTAAERERDAWVLRHQHTDKRLAAAERERDEARKQRDDAEALSRVLGARLGADPNTPTHFLGERTEAWIDKPVEMATSSTNWNKFQEVCVKLAAAERERDALCAELDQHDCASHVGVRDTIETLTRERDDLAEQVEGLQQELDQIMVLISPFCSRGEIEARIVALKRELNEAIEFAAKGLDAIETLTRERDDALAGVARQAKLLDHYASESAKLRTELDEAVEALNKHALPADAEALAKAMHDRCALSLDLPSWEMTHERSRGEWREAAYAALSHLGLALAAAVRATPTTVYTVDIEAAAGEIVTVGVTPPFSSGGRHYEVSYVAEMIRKHARPTPPTVCTVGIEKAALEFDRRVERYSVGTGILDLEAILRKHARPADAEALARAIEGGQVVLSSIREPLNRSACTSIAGIALAHLGLALAEKPAPWKVDREKVAAAMVPVWGQGVAACTRAAIKEIERQRAEGGAS